MAGTVLRRFLDSSLSGKPEMDGQKRMSQARVITPAASAVAALPFTGTSTAGTVIAVAGTLLTSVLLVRMARHREPDPPAAPAEPAKPADSEVPAEPGSSGQVTGRAR